MTTITRISAGEVRDGIISGTTLLVCAYDDDNKFVKYNLEGAIPLSEFRARVTVLEKDQKIVFYCA